MLYEVITFIDEHRLMEILATKLGYPFVEPVYAEINKNLRNNFV